MTDQGPSSPAVPALDAWGVRRRSRLFPGPFLVHADLHNHTTLSDGSGDPARAFASMRAAGLDAAALTDHSRWASAFLGLVEAPGWTGIDRTAWAATARLADEADASGEFAALRGFEWSSAIFGHMNVWGTERFTDPLATLLVSMAPWWRWLRRGGRGGLIGFNHPGTGRLRFGQFRHQPDLADRVVSLEMFNKTLDYLFQGTDQGLESPLNQCLNAGWRVGILGVSDEHGTDWGFPEGKGRAGLYVHELTRAGVLEALAARRFYAARVKGLRLDAAVNGVRMGGTVPHARGPARFEVDLDRGEAWWGRPLNVQVLRPGPLLPTLAATVDVKLPTPEEPVVAFETTLDRAEGAWVVLRVTDPAEPPDRRAQDEWATLGRAIAYSSPFWLGPAAG
ncbi:MAG TPA: CehA/McbA family metallohydrolase [Actinomycetota bacterium]|nr:CehA/McbA family metallohydrolase [Actinomycetota bacterium]